MNNVVLLLIFFGTLFLLHKLIKIETFDGIMIPELEFRKPKIPTCSSGIVLPDAEPVLPTLLRDIQIV